MFRKNVIISLFVVLWLMVGGGWREVCAQTDSLRVSVLTCSPGQEVYSLYGHTAIRVQKALSDTPLKKESPEQEFFPIKGDLEGPFDIVFNYGVFDMSKPHFVWHFVLGQTDYMVQPIPWKYFIIDYERRGSSITEQELNLTPSERNRLLANLVENCQPENCEYRYSFLYGNCTTKVRDMVEQIVVGTIWYPDTLPHQTAREILHRYTAGHPWAQEGNDLLLGAETDTILSERAATFIPDNLMQAFDGAFIRNGKGDMRPLVRSKEVVLEASHPLSVSPLQGEDADTKAFRTSPSEGEDGRGSISPLEAMLAFGAICIFILLLEMWTKRICWLWDVLLLLLQGTAGTLIAFMFFFSKHPAVDSNWQIWLLNPIYFIGIPLVIKAAIRHKTTLWYAFYFVVLALFLLFSPWIPQVFAKITVPLALCLLTRPISYYLARRAKSSKVQKKRK